MNKIKYVYVIWEILIILTCMMEFKDWENSNAIFSDNGIALKYQYSIIKALTDIIQ